MKRIFDAVVASLVLLACLPLMLIVALLIKLESDGPVMFRQKRIGKSGQIFSIYKFRSMVVNADERGPHFTSDFDPRITKIGRVVRKTSIDELPQLLNVLKGDMSLVGPRPNVPQQRSEYTEAEWNERNKVRPGITGLAQAIKRSQATPIERTQLDLEYVSKSSFMFDLYIILLTIKQLVLKGGH